MNKLIRSDINNIEAYKPGKPIQEVERELGLKGIIKLASNENPLGPSPKAVKAITKALKEINRYPEGTCFYLKQGLAKRLGVKENNLLFGNGSDELIDIILKTTKDPEAEIITADVTFVEYKICGAINGFKVVTVPLRDYTFNLEGIRAAITQNTKVIFIANPNNPTGTYVNLSETLKFLESIRPDILVVFDEAYFEFADENDFPQLVTLINKKNITLLRTFSKIYGLAGLRIGYLVAKAELISAAERVRQPFNVNSLAQVAALEALNDDNFVKKSQELVKKEKKFLTDALNKLGIWFKQSSTNFIFVRFNKDASIIFQKLLKKGIIIREMSSYQLNNYARITIGTRPENKRLIAALRQLKEEIS